LAVLALHCCNSSEFDPDILRLGDSAEKIAGIKPNGWKYEKTSCFVA
jgi:hypothetical protein